MHPGSVKTFGRARAAARDVIPGTWGRQIRALGRSRRSHSSIVVIAVLLLASCIRLPSPIDQIPPGNWTSRHGDTRHAAFAAERVPLQPRVIWEENLGRGLPAMPIVHDELIIAVISGGGIVTASATTGQRYWARRFNGSVAGQALRVGNRVFLATQHRDGNIYALDLRRGRRIWSRKLDARPVSEPAYRDGVLYQPTDRGEVIALDAARGDVLWRTALGGTAVQPAVMAGDRLLIAVHDTLITLDPGSGVIRSRVQLAGGLTAPMAVAGDTIIAAIAPAAVVAYAHYGAQLLWRYDVGNPVLAAPIIAPEGVYALTRTAQLLRLDGAQAAAVAQFDGAATEALTLTANGLLVGLLDGRLLFVHRNGETIWEERVTGSIRAAPVVRDASIYVATLAGRMIKLGS